jgi:hypothetical protein
MYIPGGNTADKGTMEKLSQILLSLYSLFDPTNTGFTLFSLYEIFVILKRMENTPVK